MSQLLTYIVGGVVILSFVGAAVVYLRGSRDQGTIATLERSNRSLIERATVLEGEVARCQIEADRLSDRVYALEHENAALRAERPSAQAIAELTKNLARHDADAKAMLSALMLREAGDD